MTEQNGLKKEYLKGYERAVRQMERSELRIREIRLNKLCPSTVIDDMPHGSDQKDLSDYAASLDAEERWYMKARRRRVITYTKIKGRIDQMENANERALLFYRYLMLYGWDEVALRLNRSYRQVMRIHSTALENFIV